MATAIAQSPVQRRRFVRRRVEGAVAVQGVVSSEIKAWRGHCLNLSEGGAAVIVAGTWLPGQVVKVELDIARRHRPMQLVARIAHRNRLYCGLEFLATPETAVLELREVLEA